MTLRIDPTTASGLADDHRRHPRKRSRLRHAVRAVTAGAVLATSVAIGVGAVATATPTGPSASSYSFSTHGDNKDTTFNQLLSINDKGQIAGYFGSGTPATTHPNKGYVLDAPYGQSNFHNENFPGSQQTQVTGINNSGTTSGFYADPAGDNFGFILKDGIWTAVIDPHTTGNMNQLLGLNNHGLAAGFYTDSKGNAHGYIFNFHNDTFKAVNIPNASSVTASGVNANGDVSGFYMNAAGATRSFVLHHDGDLTTFSAPGSTNTMALGINNSDEVVGTYAIGNSTHGFVWSGGHLRTVDDPHGVGATTINGLNSAGDLVGFYTSGNNVDGFLATVKS